ncbi:MAG: hypothetical protein NBV67_05990 [Tagaea sp.]|nr:hypothetical protein [Tagaea sp.]
MKKQGSGFFCFQGIFRVVGTSPDGDSVRFVVADPDAVDQALATFGDGIKIKWKGPKDGPKNACQLRFEAIDALETHYQQGGDEFGHQPKGLAQAARDRLIELLGITGVVWGKSEKSPKIKSAGDDKPGYILTRGADNRKYGRPVAFVYAGKAPVADGQRFRLEANHLRKSVNYRVAAEGLVYPTYYRKLFGDLRDEFDDAIANARKTAKSGSLYAKDRTNKGLDLSTKTVIATDAPIMPKLFRRLAEHFNAGGKVGGFRDFLLSKEDDLAMEVGGHETHFATFVEIQGTKIRLTVPPERLLFMK